MKRFVQGILAVIFSMAVAGGVFAWWILDVSAMKPMPTDFVMSHVSTHAIVRHAGDGKNPFAADRKAVSMGLMHYKDNCLPCHGAPGIEPAEFAKGFHPPALDLTSKPVQDFSDAQLYWIVTNGIQMTGMPAFQPTHEENERWMIVSFIRELPKLTEVERKELQEGMKTEGHHMAMDAMGGDDMKMGTDMKVGTPSTPANTASLSAQGELGGHVANLEIVGDGITVTVREKTGGIPKAVENPTMTIRHGGATEKVGLSGTSAIFTGKASLGGAKQIDVAFSVNLDGRPQSVNFHVQRN